MGNKLKSPTMIGHLSLSDSSADDYLYVQGAPITGGGSGGTKLYKYIVPINNGRRTLYFITPILKEYTDGYELINNSISILAKATDIYVTGNLTTCFNRFGTISYWYEDTETGEEGWDDIGFEPDSFDTYTVTVEEL